MQMSRPAAALIGWRLSHLAGNVRATGCSDCWLILSPVSTSSVQVYAVSESSISWCHVMSRLIRFISARWTRRGGNRATTLTSGGDDVRTTATNDRLCCRVSLLDGTDLMVNLPVSLVQSLSTHHTHRNDTHVCLSVSHQWSSSSWHSSSSPCVHSVAGQPLACCTVCWISGKTEVFKFFKNVVLVPV